MMQAFGKAQRVEFSAIVTRADGTVEDYGVIGYYHSNPILRTLWDIKNFLKKEYKKWHKQPY
jgi:hypothetical protein